MYVCMYIVQKVQLTERQMGDDWLASQLGSLSAPDLLVDLFAECECIAELCFLQRVRARLGEVMGYMVRAKLGE